MLASQPGTCGVAGVTSGDEHQLQGGTDDFHVVDTIVEIFILQLTKQVLEACLLMLLHDQHRGSGWTMGEEIGQLVEPALVTWLSGKQEILLEGDHLSAQFARDLPVVQLPRAHENQRAGHQGERAEIVEVGSVAGGDPEDFEEVVPMPLATFRRGRPTGRQLPGEKPSSGKGALLPRGKAWNEPDDANTALGSV